MAVHDLHGVRDKLGACQVAYEGGQLRRVAEVAQEPAGAADQGPAVLLSAVGCLLSAVDIGDQGSRPRGGEGCGEEWVYRCVDERSPRSRSDHSSA